MVYCRFESVQLTHNCKYTQLYIHTSTYAHYKCITCTHTLAHLELNDCPNSTKLWQHIIIKGLESFIQLSFLKLDRKREGTGSNEQTHVWGECSELKNTLTRGASGSTAPHSCHFSSTLAPHQSAYAPTVPPHICLFSLRLPSPLPSAPPPPHSTSPP